MCVNWCIWGAYMHISTCTDIYEYWYVCVQVYIYKKCTGLCICVYICVHGCISMGMYMYTCMNTYDKKCSIHRHQQSRLTYNFYFHYSVPLWGSNIFELVPG